MHAATYSAHPVCCAVGVVNCNIIEEDGLVERAAVEGKKLLAGLDELRNLPNVGDVRGLGMMCGVELVTDKSTKAPAIGLGGNLGARPIWSDPETHDWAVGIVSHLPQLLSVALARVVQDETDETGLPLTLSGPGLQDMLRLAGSPYEIWRDILLTNTDNVSRALDRLAQAVDYLRTHLASRDLQQEFAAANELYRQLRKPS